MKSSLCSQENRDQGENGAESEEDSDMDQQHNLFMKKIQHEVCSTYTYAYRLKVYVELQ